MPTPWLLLASVIPGRLDEGVRDRIIAESGGNPLALLELPRGVTVAELAGGFGVAVPLALAGRIEQSFLRRIARLPEVTQRVRIRACWPTGCPGVRCTRLPASGSAHRGCAAP